MRFKGRLDFEYGLRPIHIAALVNIIFLLFIFLILSFNLLMRPGIKVNLPKVATNDLIRHQSIDILVTGTNLTYFDGRLIRLDELRALFKESAARKASILIKADKQSSLGKVAEIWDMARELGITNINIATNKQ